MGVLLFRLRHVPDDEADDIRALLSDNGIDFYETSAGSWGISLPAIWLHDEAQLDKAKVLIDAYQQQRRKNARTQYEQLRQKGKHRTIWTKMQEAPLQSIIYLAAVLIILYLTIMPFMRIFR